MSSQANDVITITVCPLPSNSQHVLLMDSTRRLIEACTTAASAHAPGSYRGAWKGRRWTGSIKATTNDITVTFEVMTNSASTASSGFETDATYTSGSVSAGVLTATAGTTYLFNWLPMTPDYRIRITAGSSAPTALTVTAEGVLGRVSGG